MDMDTKRVLEILEYIGALKDVHTETHSKRHVRRYFDKRVLFADTFNTGRISTALADLFLNDPVDVVCGPPQGGMILAGPVSERLREKFRKEIPVISIEKNEDGTLVVSQASREALTGKTVLIVEDTVTTGGSVREVVRIARASGAKKILVGAILNRGDVRAKQLDADRFRYLASMVPEDWLPENCPLCKAGIPLEPTPGK